MSIRHRILLLIIALVLCAGLLDQSGPAVGSLPGMFGLGIGGAAWLISWIVRGILWLIARAHQRPERASGVGLLAEVAMVLFASALMWMQAPLRLRFALSEPAMTRFVEKGEPAAPTHLGLFPVREVRREGKQTILVVEPGFMDLNGFVHSPDGDFDGRDRERLSPHWRRWTEGW